MSSNYFNTQNLQQNLEGNPYPQHFNQHREDEDDEDEDDLMGQRDIEKLSHLWKTMKEEKKQMSSSRSNAQLRDSNKITNPNQNIFQGGVDRRETFEVSNNSSDKRLVVQEQTESKKPLNVRDYQPQEDYQQQSAQRMYELSRAQEKNSTLVRKLAEAEEELDKCHLKIMQLSQAPFNNTQAAMQGTAQEAQINKYAVGLLQGDMEESSKLVKQLRLSLEEFQDKCSLLSSENIALKEKNGTLTQQLDAQTAENTRIKTKLAEVEVIIDEIILEKNSKGVTMLEIEYLKNDIEKLLQLLGSVPEYKDFFRFAKDSREITNLKYIPRLANVKQDSDDKILKVSINAKMLWVPRDAFSLALYLKQKYNNKFDEHCIEELLFGYNKIFSDREQKAQERFKKIYTAQIESLRFELDKKTSYKQVVTATKKAAATLKKPNSTFVPKQAQPQAIHRQLDNAARETEQEKENQLFLTDAVRLQEDYERQIQEKNEEIEKLNLRILELEGETMKYDKLNYMEGSLWMLDKLTKEVLRFKENVLQTTRQIHSQPANSIKEISSNYSWLVDTVQQGSEQLLTRLAHMKESTAQQLSKVKSLSGQSQSRQHGFSQDNNKNNNYYNNYAPLISTFASPQSDYQYPQSDQNNNNNINNYDDEDAIRDQLLGINKPPQQPYQQFLQQQQTAVTSTRSHQQLQTPNIATTTRSQSPYCNISALNTPQAVQDTWNISNNNNNNTSGNNLQQPNSKSSQYAGYSSFEQYKSEKLLRNQ